MERRALDDAELIHRAQDGDTDAYGELVQRYQALAVRVAYLITREVPEAEDVAQEAFVKIFYSLHRFRPGAPFRPWLLRIVVNEARNLRKAARRRASRMASASEGFSAGSAAPSPEAAALASQQREALRAALMRLREEDRLVIAYRYFFDLSEAETAEALGVARGTIKSRLARSLKRLQVGLRDWYPLLILTPDVETLVRSALGDLLAHLPHDPSSAFTDAVLGRIGAGERPLHQPSWSTVGSAPGALGLVGLAVLVLAATLFASVQRDARPSPTNTPPNGEPVIVFGGDLTEPERQHMAGLLGADDTSRVDSVTRAELQAALEVIGLPVSPTDEAVSSVALVCREPNTGLEVHTQYITRIPAAAYAQALLTARAVEASLAIGALPTQPVSGETALVGVLKASAQCQGGKEADPARVRLAYEQFRVASGLAQEPDEWARTSAMLLQAARAVITGQAGDEASMAAALVLTGGDSPSV